MEACLVGDSSRGGERFRWLVVVCCCVVGRLVHHVRLDVLIRCTLVGRRDCLHNLLRCDCNDSPFFACASSVSSVLTARPPPSHFNTHTSISRKTEPSSMKNKRQTSPPSPSAAAPQTSAPSKTLTSSETIASAPGESPKTYFSWKAHKPLVELETILLNFCMLFSFRGIKM